MIIFRGSSLPSELCRLCCCVCLCKYVVVQTRDKATLVFLLVFVLESLCVTPLPDSLLSQWYFRADRMLIRRLKPEQKRAAAVTTTEAHIVSDDNTEPVLYMTTARQRPTSQPQRTCTQTHQQPIRHQENPPIQQQTISAFVFFDFIWLSEFASGMFGRTLLLICFAIFFCAGETVAGQVYKQSQVYENVSGIYTAKFRPGEIGSRLMYSSDWVCSQWQQLFISSNLASL